MIKELRAGVAAMALISSAAYAQTYVPVSPPPAAVAPPSLGVPGSTTTTTTSLPTSDHTTTVTKGVDANGDEITKKETYREGVAGSTETHEKTKTDPVTGTTTRSTTTTTHE